MFKFIKNCSLLSYNFVRFSSVLSENINNTGILIINSPKTLNSLTQNVINEMKSNLYRWKDDKNITHFILRGAGDKAFCAGGDVREIVSVGMNDKKKVMDYCFNEYSLDYLLATFPKPYVSIIDGLTFGGGCGISVHGKYTVATETTKWAMPETAIGLFPDCGVCYELARMKHNLGIFMGLTGYRLTGFQLYFMDIISHLVPKEKIPQLVKDLSSIKTANKIPEVLNSHHSTELENSSDLIQFKHELSLIDSVFSSDTVEGVIEALKNEVDSFRFSEVARKWCQHQLDVLSKMSPLSLKLTMSLLQKSKNLSLPEVMLLECRLVSNLMKKDSDFFEGVRAALIDKDRNPRWIHSSVYDVPDVEHYFSPISDEDRLFCCVA